MDKGGITISEINKLIHEPARLQIMAALIARGKDIESDFVFLRDKLHFTDGNLGSHLDKLEGAKYIRMKKTFVGKKPKTFVRLSSTGFRAFTDHIAALRDLLDE